MKSFLRFIDNIEQYIITILLPLMCIVVLFATFMRYTELLLIPWGEELARYLMVWIVFLGIAAGAKNNRHFGVEVFVRALPLRAQKYFLIFRTLVISAFLIFVIYLSLKLMGLQMKMGQTSPSLEIPIWLAYLAVPVGAGLMIIRNIQFTVNTFKNGN
ncbi:MAG: TRAP transporter small permease [Bacillota bacterium]